MKGLNVKQELTGRDIFAGQNGSGKTTHLQAIGLAMLGYVPGNGKKNEETFKMASDNVMSVGLQLDDFSFERTFERKEKENKTGETKIEISQGIQIIPSKGERTAKQKEDRILEEIGTFPVMLDFNEFLSLSDAKRRDFFYNLSPINAKSWTKEKVGQYLKDSLLNLELKENNPDKYEAIETCIDDALSTAFPDHFDAQAGLLSLIDYVKNKLSYWKNEQKKNEGAVSKLVGIKNQLQETDKNIAKNKQESEDIQLKLQELSALIAADTEKKKANDKRDKDIQDLEFAIEVKKKQETIKELNQKLADLESQKVPKPDYQSIKKGIEDSIETQRELLLNGKNKVSELNIKTKQLQSEHERYSNNIENLNSDKKSCVLDISIACPKDFGKYKIFAASKIKEIETELQKIADTVDETNKANATIINTITILKGQLQEVQDDEAEYIKKDKEYTNQISTIKTNIELAKSLQVQIDEDTEKLSKLKAIPVEITTDIELASKQKEGLTNQATELKKKIEEQEKAKITLSNLQTSLVDGKKSSYYMDAYKLINDAVGPNGIQGEIVKSILDPVKDDIQHKLKLLGVDEEFYFRTESDNNKEIFQFGWYSEGKGYRNFDALSQGESILLLTALIVTIVGRSSPKLKVLMIDNIENLDSYNLQMFFAGLNVIGEDIDNIIIAGVIDGSDRKGFKTWWCGSDDYTVVED
jgi:exonuclease SbcC